MEAMVFIHAQQPLSHEDRKTPVPGPAQVLVEVSACAVCRTDLHVVDGELKDPKLPLIPGHEIVGRVRASGPGANHFYKGERIGIPWLGWTCGVCRYCQAGMENLCDTARFTGYTIDGGYAEYTVADERFCFRIMRPWIVFEPESSKAQQSWSAIRKFALQPTADTLPNRKASVDAISTICQPGRCRN